MSELTRITISLENPLLDQFDRINSRKGYQNRSEAIGDLIRGELLRQGAESVDSTKTGRSSSSASSTTTTRETWPTS